MIKAGIVGGAGYTAGELIRILINHPNVELCQVVSASQVGKKVYHIHQDLIGIIDLIFESNLNKEVDVIFLCQGHGKSREYLLSNEVDTDVRIIDLSQDFRHQSTANLADRSFLFGLPELSKSEISGAKSIANPGCFATAIMLGLLPLAKKGLLTDEIHVHAITGSTGAGQQLSETSHFSFRNNNVSVYKPFEHQHLTEIKETLDAKIPINFIPMRGNFTRGIFASIYLNISASEEALKSIYNSFYAEAPFTHISDETIHLKQVVNTNNCLIHLQKIENKIHITTAIDNLIKGASGQAVQNMNLMFGLDEAEGLRLKGSFF